MLIKNMNHFVKNNKYIIKRRWKKIIIIIIDFCIAIVLCRSRKRVLPEPVKKILLIKPDHLGDLLIFTAILPLVKKYYPKVIIDIVVGSWGVSFLKNNPHINKVYTVDHFFLNRSTAYSKIYKIYRFIHSYFSPLLQLRKNSYDVCLLARVSGFPNLIIFARLTKAKYIIGHSVLGFGGLCDCVVDWKYTGCHELDHMLELLVPLGIVGYNAKDLHSELFPANIDSMEVKKIMQHSGVKAKEFAVICPGAGHLDRTNAIFIDEWVQIIVSLFNIYLNVIISGTQSELILHDKIINKFASIYPEKKAQLISLAGKLSIQQTYLLFTQAGFIYTLDSLAAHIASMVTTPTVSLYLYVKPKKDELAQHLEMWRPLRSDIKVIATHAEFQQHLSEIK